MLETYQHYHPGQWMHALGFRSSVIGSRRRNYRATWGEFSWGLAFGLKLYSNWDDHQMLVFKPFFGSFYFNPFNCRSDREYGFDFVSFSGLHLYFGKRYCVLAWPWEWEHVRWDYLSFDAPSSAKVIGVDKSRSWLSCRFRSFMPRWLLMKWARAFPRPDKWREIETIKNDISRDLPYRYTRENGEVQDRTATVFVRRGVWRMRWIPFVRKSHTCIDFTFNEDVGEKVGTWKGGCVASSYEMKPNESPEECLQRMRVERKFK